LQRISWNGAGPAKLSRNDPGRPAFGYRRRHDHRETAHHGPDRSDAGREELSHGRYSNDAPGLQVSGAFFLAPLEVDMKTKLFIAAARRPDASRRAVNAAAILISCPGLF
jgi:hypothetical protein